MLQLDEIFGRNTESPEEDDKLAIELRLEGLGYFDHLYHLVLPRRIGNFVLDHRRSQTDLLSQMGIQAQHALGTSSTDLSAKK